MAILLFKLDKLFMLLVPELVVGVAVGVSFPNESDFVQNSLSIKSNFVTLMKGPLPLNPPPKKRLVLLVSPWHHAMALLSFKLDNLFIFHIPLLVMFRHGSQKALLSKRTKVGGCGIAKKTKRSVRQRKLKGSRWQQQKASDCRVKLLAAPSSFLVFLRESLKTCPVSAVPVPIPKHVFEKCCLVERQTLDRLRVCARTHARVDGWND
jgi:hypothetical protein